MKLKAWVLLLISSICFAFVGIVNLLDKKYATGIMFIVLAGIYVYLSIANHKTMNKSNEKSLSDTEIETMDNELKLLIADGKKTEAIKRYRVITGLGLKEAYEYVEFLSGKSLSDAEIETMDNELKLLIADGKKTKAIKRYRTITGFGLLESKEYVDLLSAKLQIKEISKAKE